jgi:hypothetical protein
MRSTLERLRLESQDARKRPMRTVTRLSGLELSDWRGERVRLAELWKTQPVVLVFIRHFG